MIGALYQGAGRSYAGQKHLNNIEQRILTDVTTLPYDVATAKVFGQIRAKLETAGSVLPDADIQIAATAIYHDLELVSGNIGFHVLLHH